MGDANYDAFWGLVLIFGASCWLVVFADVVLFLNGVNDHLDVPRAVVEAIIGIILIYFGARHFLRDQ